MPGVARGIKKIKKPDFLAYVTLGVLKSSLKKVQPIWSSCLAIYRQHIYK